MLSNNPDGLGHAQLPPHEGAKGFDAVLSFFLLPRQEFPAPGSKLLPHRQNNLYAEASVLRVSRPVCSGLDAAER